MVDRLWGSWKALHHHRAFGAFAMGALVLLAFAMNVHIGGVSSSWSRFERLEFIDSVASSPVDCQVFYLTGPTVDSTPGDWVLASIDAYEISDHFGIPTINGYSGLEPQGLQGVSAIDSEGYEGLIKNWIADNALEGVYAYDESNNVWVSAEERFGEDARQL